MTKCGPLPRVCPGRCLVWSAIVLGRQLLDGCGYSHLSDTEAPIIPTNSMAPNIPTVFWLGSHLSDSKKRTMIVTLPGVCERGFTLKCKKSEFREPHNFGILEAQKIRNNESAPSTLFRISELELVWISQSHATHKPLCFRPFLDTS